MKAREYMVMAALAVCAFVVNLDVSITNIAMPSFNAYFKVGTGDTAKIVLAYLLALSGFLLIFGKLSDDLGAKKVFVPGIIAFMVASVFCALSETLPLLIFSRFLQGLGGAMLLATPGAIVANYLPESFSGKAYGLVTASGGVGFALGAPVGGYIIEHFSWHWIFIINVPICIITLLMAVYSLDGRTQAGGEATASKDGETDAPERAMTEASGAAADGPDENARKTGGFDYPGAIYCFLFLAAFIYSVNQGKIDGWFAGHIVACYAAFAVFLGLFIAREKSAPQPLLDFDLLRNGAILAAFFATFAVVMTLDGLNFLFPLFFETVKKMTPSETGNLLMTFPLISIILSPLAGHLSDISGPGRICRLSLFIITTAVLLFYNFGPATGLWTAGATLVFFGTGLSLFYPSVTALVMSRAPQGREGTAMALYSSVTNLGGVLGISIFEWTFAMAHGGDLSSHTLAAADVAKGFSSTTLLAAAICATGFTAVMASTAGGTGTEAAAAEKGATAA